MIVSREIPFISMCAIILNQNKDFDILLEKSKFYFYLKNLIKKIFPHKRIIVTASGSPRKIELYKLYNFFKVYSHNRKLYNQLIKNNLKKKINLKTYDEVWFSNENISKILINYKNFNKMKYFSHGIGDLIFFIKKQKILNIIKNKIENWINSRLLYYFCNYKYVKPYSLISKFSKIKSIKSISLNNIFFFNFKKHKKIVDIINVNVPHSNIFNLNYDNETQNNYFFFFFNTISHKIIKKCTSKKIILTFKKSIPLSMQKKFLSAFQNKYHYKKFSLQSAHVDRFSSVENLFFRFNINNYVSTFSTTMYILKQIQKNSKIYDYTKILEKFWDSTNNNRLNVHKKNEKNYFYLKKVFKKIAQDIN